MHNLVCVRRSIRRRPEELLDEPQNHQEFIAEISVENKVYNNILEVVGNTPLVKLQKIPKDHGLACDIYVKCEYMNPGGSIKDRIATTMIADAADHGRVKNGTVFVEPTSGNTGIGIAFNTAYLGHKSKIVTTQKNDGEKMDTIRLLGSEVIMLKDTDDEMKIAKQINDEDPANNIMLDQFDNPVNPRTHYKKTAEEIASALAQVDMVAMGAGTGGTMTGIGHRMKELHPNCLVTVAEPDGSTMINTNAKKHPFLVEGIGGDWVPSVLDKKVIDHIEVVTDKESFLMSRELAAKESLLCGGSSGAALSAAIKAAKALNLGVGKHIVVILPDGIRNYMSKFVKDQWMEANLFMDPPQRDVSWWNKPITEITPSNQYPSVDQSFTCEKVLRAMDKVDIAVVTGDNGQFVGAVSKDSFRNKATNPSTYPKRDNDEFPYCDPVSDHLMTHCYHLALNGDKGVPTVGLVSRILDITPFVVLGHQNEDCFKPHGVVTGDDVMDYIFHQRASL